MNTTSMSLHRVMAEIKSIEEKLQGISSTQFIRVVQGEPRDDVAVAERARFLKDSKSSLDKITSMIKNLASLKSVRNKANSTVQITVAGQSMTIDEALAAKVALQYKQNLVDTLLAQITSAQAMGARQQSEIDTKVAAQLASMFAGSRKASEEEINVIKGGFERSLKPVVLAPEGMQTTLENMKEAIVEFEKEIDFTLSEANALTKIEVTLV